MGPIGGTKETTETFEGGNEFTDVEFDVLMWGEVVAKSLVREIPSIAVGADVVVTIEATSPPGNGTVVATGVGKLSSC